MLLEREEEQVVLNEAVAEARSGSGALVLVDGEAGTGTTALLQRLADVAGDRGALVLRSAGTATERSVPFGVVRQLILQLAAEPGVAVPPVAHPVLAAVADPRAAARGPAAFADTLHRLHILFAATAAERTVALLVDDLRWADEASLHALAHLAARLDGMPVLIAVVRKGGLGAPDPLVREIADRATHRVRARPLTRHATARLVENRFGADCPAEFARTCHEVTGGRPKDLRVLADRARLRRLGAPHWRTRDLRELGESLCRERLLLALRREPVLDAYAKAAAVLGPGADRELVARLAGLSEEECDHARASLAALWPAGAGGADGVPDIGGVVLRAMSAEESSHWYREASVLLEESGAGPEEAVAPLLHVDRIGDPWEIHQLRAAAAAARRRGAPDDAVRYLGRALADVPADGPVRAELLFELGTIELDSGAPSARRHLAQAARLMPRPGRRAEMVASVPMRTVAGDPELVGLVRETAAALGTPPEEDRQGGWLAMRLEARVRYVGLDDHATVVSAARRLRELGELHGDVSEAERELRTVLLFCAAMHGRTGHRDVVRMARQVLDHEPAHSCLHGPALELVPPVLCIAEAPQAAASWLGAARLYAAREGTPAQRARVEAQWGLVLLARGEAAAARACALRAAALTAGEPSEDRLLPTLTLGRIATDLDDEELAGQVDIDVEGPGADVRLFALDRTLRGIRAEARGDLTVALTRYLDCGRALERAGWFNPWLFRWQVRAARLQYRLGMTARAQETAEQYQERAVAWGTPSGVGRALRLRGELTEGPHGTALLREAVDALDAAGSRLDLAHALIALGQRLQGTSDAEGERLAGRGRLLLAEARSAPADAGFAARPARAVAAGLTPAETKVAQRAARGLSNRDIADELEISVRAVERHLTSSYRKFGIAGREELARMLEPDTAADS